MGLKELEKQIPYKWKVQSYSYSSAFMSCVAYIDARDVMDLLDEEIGPENWQSDYKEIKGNLYAGIAIKINDDWIWKWDCGAESRSEKEKGEASDGFKRAAVKWGVGRFLYSLPIQYLKTNEVKNDKNKVYPVDEKGNKIKDITNYINIVFKPQLPNKIISFTNSQKEKLLSNLEKKLSNIENHSQIESIKSDFLNYCEKNNIEVSFISVETIFKKYENKLSTKIQNQI